MVYTVSVPNFYDIPELTVNRARTSTLLLSSLRLRQANLVANTASVISEKLDDLRSLSPEPVKDTTRVRIPKPTGEVGWLEQGRYKLHSVLSANSPLYSKILASALVYSILLIG
jgi:hypothetical protein